MKFIKKHFYLISFCLLLLFLGYGIDRVSNKFFSPYSFNVFIGVISLSFLVLYKAFRTSLKQNWSLRDLILLGIIVRLILLASTPNLSDDYYRYLWDGILVNNGINPYLYQPAELMNNADFQSLNLSEKLYNGFNSQYYYSVYPPINQFIFYCSAWVGQGNIWVSTFVIRLFILLSEFGTIYVLLKLLKLEKQSINLAFWYILNPLILLEFTVNLHFEGFMIFFLLVALYFLRKNRIILSGLFWAFSICTKIIPIMYMVFLLKRTKFKNTLFIGSIALTTIILLFIPFWNPLIVDNIKDSLDKYFGYFEFNAGIPYLIRFIGNEIYGYSVLFKVMPVIKQCFIVFVLLFGLSSYFTKSVKSIYSPIYWTAFVYFLVAGILHPWYITILIPLGLLSKNYTGIVWSFLIFLSYSAYESKTYHENYYLISLEFSLVLFFMVFENLTSTQSKIKLLIKDTPKIVK